jgi:hypothetical protein
MRFPNGVLKICGDCDVGISTLEKLQALAAAREATGGPRGQDSTPLTSRQGSSTFAPHVQPLDNEVVLMKTIQILANAA